MSTRLSIICLLATACGPVVPALETKGITNAVDVAKMTAKLNAAISASIVQSPARQAQASSTFTRDCVKGGSKTGTVKGKLIGSSEQFDGSIVATYELEFSSCKTDTYELYGIATWSTSAMTQGSGSARYAISLNGTIGTRLDSGAIEANLTYKDLKVTAAVSQTGTTNNYEITVTGSVDVGSKSYVLTQDDFRDVFAIPQ